MADRAVAPRNVSPLLQKLRNVLMGRTHTVENGNLRYAKYLSKRDQPPPALPAVPNSIVSQNAYHARDARRMVSPPVLVVENKSAKMIAAESEASKPKALGSVKPKFPGKTYLWD